MNESKHTPGPWRPGHLCREDHSCNCRFIFGNDDRMGCVATVEMDDGKPMGIEYPSREEAKANMLLIAAAPDMLAALWKVRNRLADCGDTFCGEDADWCYDAIASAISKAEGRP